MDFNEFVRTMDEKDPLVPLAERILLITFSPNPDPTRSVPIARHPDTGLIVFPDMKRLGAQIKGGETYFCEITDYVSPEGKKVHYANPIQRVDASFLFDLRPEQVAALVEVLQRSASGPLLEQAKAQMQKQMQDSVRPQLEAVTVERDAAKAEAERQSGEMVKLREENASLRRQVDEMTKRTGGTASHVPPKSAPAAAEEYASPTWLPLGPPARHVQAVRRISEEVLESSDFRDGHYFVHMSPDRRLLFIHMHPEGNLPAVAGKLTIPGLGVLRPFDHAEDLPARLDLRNGGVLVDISAV